MDFSKLVAILQVVNGVAGLLAQIFQNAQGGARSVTGVATHVETIHTAATSLSESSTKTKET